LQDKLSNKIKQFSKFKDDFDSLTTWLGEAEGTLKSYSPCNTLSEKEEQLNKYEVRQPSFSLLSVFDFYSFQLDK
jgi:hypothetical protein